MQDQSQTNAALVEAFISGFLDKRMLPYKSIKETHALCRKAVETSLRKDSDMNNVIRSQEWIKKLIVDAVLLRLNFYGLLNEMKKLGENEKNYNETPDCKSFS